MPGPIKTMDPGSASGKTKGGVREDKEWLVTLALFPRHPRESGGPYKKPGFSSFTNYKKRRGNPLLLVSLNKINCSHSYLNGSPPPHGN